MTTIEKFIEARLEEKEHSARQVYYVWNLSNASGKNSLEERELNVVQSIRDILDLHKKWPILIEKPPASFTMENVTSPNPLSVDAVLLRMTKEIQYATYEKYVEMFGVDPPTDGIIRAIARMWRDHPDFKEEWS